MPRRRTFTPLDVFLNGRRVGVLQRHSSGAVEFQYASEWLEWEHASPVSLSLPLREDRYTGHSVTAVFDNLLPDAESVRQTIAQRTGAPGHDVYSLLAALGGDCIGALQFLPEGVEPGPAGAVQAMPVDDREIARRLRQLATHPLGMDENEDFRLSLAGAQEKTALLRLDGKWHIPRGPTPSTHILKPAIGVLPNGIDMSRSVENEYLCLKLIEGLGLPVANAAISTFDGITTLVVERFDRHWGSDGRLLRVPQEDCCQALSVPPSRKYDSDGGPGMVAILNLLRGSDEPLQDQRTFITAQILFWLLGAIDGHAKNFSLFLYPGGRYRLAPLYDVVSAQPAIDAGQLTRRQVKLAMAVGNNRHYLIDNILPRHFFQVADRANLSESLVNGVFDELQDRADHAIDTALAALPAGFPTAIADSITGQLRARLERMQRTRP